MTQYSISAANRITGKSRTTITKHLRTGKLSFTEDGEGNKLIDASELMRVYGDDCDFSREEGAAANNNNSASKTEQGVQPNLSSLKLLLDKEIAERERERGQLQQQIDHLQDALKLAQEGQNKAMLLLEDRSSGGGEWQAAIKKLEERIADQEEGAKKQLAAITEKARREARENIKNKYWWQVVFGE